MKDWKTICSVIFAMNLKSAAVVFYYVFSMGLRLFSRSIKQRKINLENRLMRTMSFEDIRCSSSFCLVWDVVLNWKKSFNMSFVLFLKVSYVLHANATWNSSSTSPELQSLHRRCSRGMFLYRPYSISSLWLLILNFQKFFLCIGFFIRCR
jgi:hypothetical protein